VNDDPNIGEYGFYPAPVEDGRIAYDDLYLKAVDDTSGFVVVIDIPEYEAIYNCTLEVKGYSPLRHGDPAVRLRAMVNTMRLLGERVERAVADE
jgi:hypothetical protein